MQSNGNPHYMELKYGENPNQKPAKVTSIQGVVESWEGLPFEVVNGTPGVVNIKESLRGWKLVKELDETFDLPAAAALKHINPAGAAIAVELDDVLKEAYFCGKKEISPLATAYYRADGTDPKSAYGGTVCLSRKVDYATALALKSRVVDVIVAPEFEQEALELISKKKEGKIVILKMDPKYMASEKVKVVEDDLAFEFDRNDYKVTDELLTDCRTELSDDAKRDLKVGVVIAKYTKSNKTIYTLDGQSTGIMACQQSRVDSMRWAGDKSTIWLLRQHHKVLGIKKDEKLTMYERISEQTKAIENMLDGKTKADKAQTIEALLEQRNFDSFRAVTCGFLPFADCVDEANMHGVGTILYPKVPVKGVRFDEIAKCADECSINLVLFPYRLFLES